MTDKPTDFTKPVQTKSGLKARVLCTDFKDEFTPIVATVTLADGSEAIYHYCRDGRYNLGGRDHGLDLINVPAEVADTQSDDLPWRDAVNEALIAAQLGTWESFPDARTALLSLITWEQQVALDPAVSKSARELIDEATKPLVEALERIARLVGWLDFPRVTYVTHLNIRRIVREALTRHRGEL